MKRLNFILSTLFLIQSLGQAQNLFSKIYEGSYSRITMDVCETIDKGYIVLGFTDTPQNQQQIYLIKTDQFGDTLWTKSIGGMGWSYGYSIKQTSDKGYIIAGHTSNSIELGVYSDLFLAKISEKGEVIWTKTFGGSADDGANSVEIMDDHGFMVLGSTKSFGFEDGNPYLIRTNSMGDTIWTKTPSSCGLSGGSLDDFHMTSDGGYIIAGTTFGWNEGEWGHVYVMKLDSNGDKVWSNVYNNYNGMSDVRIKESPDRGLVIVGPSYINLPNGPYTSEILLTKTDNSGNVLWSNAFIGGGYAFGNSVDNTIDGGIIISGKTSDIWNDCVYIIKTNSVGDTLWTKLNHSIAVGIGNIIVKQTSDEGFIVTGPIRDESSNKINLFLLKADKYGNSSELPATATGENIIDFRVFPNPANDILNIQRNDNSKVLVEIIDLKGRIIYQKTYPESFIKIDISKYPIGPYILKMISDTKTDKILIIKSKSR